jgi:nudix motif 8
MNQKSFSFRWLQRIQTSCAQLKGGKVTISPHVSNDLLEKNAVRSTPKRTAAVLIPLCNRNGQASIIFTQRTDDVSTHKGQVSFPGGHVEANETAIEAAIRECYEELGNDIGAISILGVCQTIPAITGTLVTPIIGFIDRDVEDFAHFEPSAGEVKKVFSHTLEELMQPAFRSQQTLERNGIKMTMPVFNDDADTRIWGLTAMILDGVLKSAIQPTLEQDVV